MFGALAIAVEEDLVPRPISADFDFVVRKASLLLRKHQTNLLYLQEVERWIVVEVKLGELVELAFAEAMQVCDEVVGEIELF